MIPNPKRLGYYSSMSTAADVYRQINDLRQVAHERDVAATNLRNERDGYAPVTSITLRQLGADDWAEDPTYGRTLGDPETDWSVTTEGDQVTVWAAGEDVATGTIAGAGSL